MSDLRPKITYLAPFVPYRSIPHAGGQFFFHYLVRLSRSADVCVVAPGSEVNRAALREDVAPGEIHLVPIRPRPRSRIGFLPRLLANTAAGVTPGWQVLRGFRADPSVWERVGASDLVELEWPWYLPFIEDIRRVSERVPVTAFEYDVICESLARRTQSGAAHERTLGRVAAARAQRKEPALLNRCDLVFVFSERDRRTLQGLGVHRPIELVDPYVLPGAPPRTDRTDQVALFVGAMTRPENHQGAEWLAREVWPTVAQACPGARLVLAGAGPPPSLQRLGGGSVEVTGYVDDLDALYRRARVFAAANLTGAGVKFKVLDALRHGLPVVATPIAAEGIADEPGSAGFAAITADRSEIAAALVDLLSSPERARAIGDAGREWVDARYDFAGSVDRVLAIYRRLIAESAVRASPPAPPQDAAERAAGDPEIE